MGDANFDSFFGGGATGNGVAPIFRRKRALLNRSGGYFPDGFAGNGDYIRLPADSTGTIQYYNASNSLVWSKTANDLFTGSNTMITFTMGVGGLLYCLTSASGVGSLRLSTVDSAGTVTQVGAGFTPSPALNSFDAWTPFGTVSAAGAQINGSEVGVQFTNRKIVVNLTTGALVSDTTIRCAKGSVNLGPYYFAVTSGPSVFAGVNGYARLSKNSGSLSSVADVALHGDTGVTTAGAQPGVTAAILSWKTELVQVSGCATNIDSSVSQGDYCIVFDPATLAADVATLAANLRFNV